jgi:peptide chain release factor 1
MINLLPKIKQLKKRGREIEDKLTQSQQISVRQRAKLSREQAELSLLLEKINRWEKIKKQITDNGQLTKGEPELAEIAKEENRRLEKAEKKLQQELIRELITADPRDRKNVILEIRAGTGGEEAELFNNDLFRMYQRYSQNQGWQFNISSLQRSELGGIREAVVEIKGNNVYQKLKYEGGVHRVQRIPKTEKAGRIHTSAATVVVLPEADPTEVKISEKELEISTFRSSGPGGQSVNTTDSAVRITHKPTNITVSCQDEKSQLKNRDKAMKILRARLMAKKEAEQQSQKGQERKLMVGSGDRSEKIRTYNFPQNRITDHRIKYSSRNLEGILDGNLDELIKRLGQFDQKAKLAQLK